MSDREELEALRRMAELEAKAGGEKKSMAPKGGVRSALNEMALAATGGMLRGGPMLGMFGESQKQANQLLEQGAYKAGGGVTDALAGKVPPEVAGGAGYATNVGIQAIPTIAGSLLSSEAAAPTLNKWGHTMMQKAMKPSRADVTSGKAERAIQTLLDEGLNVSRGSLGKMRDTITNLNDEVVGIIQNSPANINKAKVAERIGEVVKKYEASVDPEDLKSIERVWTNFLTHPQLSGKNEMPIQFAQKMKQMIGAKLGESAFGFGLKPGAERDAYKGLMRGLKEEIATAEPAVGPLNKRESDLLNALKLTSNRMVVDSNKNILGLGILNPKTLPIWLYDRSPLALSLTGRGLYQGQRAIPGALGGAAGGLYGAAYLGQEEQP